MQWRRSGNTCPGCRLQCCNKTICPPVRHIRSVRPKYSEGEEKEEEMVVEVVEEVEEREVLDLTAAPDAIHDVEIDNS